jgi:hypothetical protein
MPEILLGVRDRKRPDSESSFRRWHLASLRQAKALRHRWLEFSFINTLLQPTANLTQLSCRRSRPLIRLHSVGANNTLEQRKMSRIAYLLLSIGAFLFTATFHVASYSQEVPRSFLTAAWLAAAALCVPLVLLFVRIKKEKSSEEVWRRFWNSVIERCPRWIWGSMSVAWFLAIFTFIRGVFTREPAPMTFHSALVLMPIAAALSYSVTLCRR